MARRHQGMLPGSDYATPGVVGEADGRTIPVTDQQCGGLIEIEVVRSSTTAKLRAKCFGFLTIINRKRGGGRPERGAFCALQFLRHPLRRDRMIVRGFWLIDRSDLARYYPADSPFIIEGQEILDNMSEDAIIADMNWPESGGVYHFDVMASVARRGGALTQTGTRTSTTLPLRHSSQLPSPCLQSVDSILTGLCWRR